MTSKGESKAQKSLSAPKIRDFHRKEYAWTQKSRPGPYKKEESVPMTFALRHLVKIAATQKVADRILAERKAKLNGKTTTNNQLSVGIFDILELEGMKNAYMFRLTKKGSLEAVEIERPKHITKPVKIKNKWTGKGKKVFISTQDGRTIETTHKDARPGDSVLLKMPEQKIEKILKMEKGAIVLLTGGKHVGKTAKIMALKKGTMTRDTLVQLKSEDMEFETTGKYVLVTE